MKQLLTAIFMAYGALLAAQPANDNCAGVIDLGIAPACPETIFTNVNATASNIGFGNNPSCFNGGIAPRDVWFAFTTNDTTLDYSITVTGLADGGFPAMRNPQIALYRGDCEVDGLAEIQCATSAPGETLLRLDVYGLTPNVTYFVRISDYSPTATPNWGTFELCVDQLSPVFNIDDGSSTACFGELFDTGGSDGDYSNNETHTFTICPTDFNTCITFTLDYYNIESGEFDSPDQLSFYDAATADPGALITTIGGLGFPSDGGGGGVCFPIQASSGCLTVQFSSDGSVTAEGFAGHWECSTVPCAPDSPITVQTNITEQDILNSITSLQTLVTVTDINCPQNAYGNFQSTDNSLGLQRGLLLTSGDLNWAVGPNNDGGGGNLNTDNGAPGDPDLDYLSVTFGDGTLSNDACIIELDVTAFTNEITFEYIFGSEEYPEFVEDFNDIFAFLISGPGIVGDPNIGNQQNIAVLPDGSNTIVEINNVNNVNNWQYYRNNIGGGATQYDGLTSDFLGVKKSLTARASVIPCSTYHLKIAIADRLDFRYDSGVFLSEIRGGTPRLTAQFNSGIDYLIENCTNTPDNVVVQLSNVLDETATYRVQVGGTAIRDVDYTLNLPDTITFLPGQTELSFLIFPLNDNLTEGIETITISLTNDFGCGEVVYTTLTIELHDELVVNIIPDADTTFVCQGATAQLGVEGAATYFWTPVNVFDDPLSPTPVATPTNSIWVRVEGNVGICSDTDSIYLQIIDPVISVAALDPPAICQGDSVRLSVTDNVNNTNLVWTPATGINDPNSPNPVVTPQETTTYIATVRLFECAVSDSITIDVNPFEFPQIGNDTLVCQSYGVQLAEMIDAVATVYSWTPTTGLSDPTVSGPIATPDVTTTYTLIATSQNGACADTAQITVTVVPADVDIQQPDTLEICLGTVVPMTAVTSTGNAQGLLWSTNLPGTLSDTIGLNVVVTTSQTATYYTRFEVGACVVFDSVYVRVDSLPFDRAIIADPEKDPYCPGDVVILRSAIFEPSDFPDIEFQWLPGPGFETPDTLWNMVISAVDTAVYSRVISNRGCLDTVSITINVVQPPSPRVIPSDTLICSGELVQLQAFDYGEYPISWTPVAGLSCTDCPNPIATPNSTTVYNLQVDVPNCPVGASANIVVIPGPTVEMNNDQTVCLGTSVQLNLDSDAFTQYQWSSNVDAGFSSTDPLLSVTPLVTTTYTLTATRQNCPPRIRSITITVVQPPTLMASQDITICRGESTTLTATVAPTIAGGAFTWFRVGENTPLSNTSSLTVGPDGLSALNRYEVVYAYGPNNSCGPLREVVEVTVVEPVGIDAITSNIPDTTTIVVGTAITLTAATTPGDPVGAMYFWSSDGGPEQMGGPVFTDTPTPAESTTITYQLRIKSADGCISTGTYTREIIVPDVVFPNVFTPNGDDVNDLFRPLPTQVSGVLIIEDFKIYNRWGQVVYNGKSNDNIGWNGEHNGSPAPIDVYVYRVKFRYPDGPLFEKSGDLTLIR
jgi:gliding motility-associated-like protein